ncbi:MAG: Ig-like domain-containing protein [candidate division WOR-3 bacterium]
MLSPPDSAIVSGTVPVQVEAYDSNGVAAIDFYADGIMIASESSAAATFEWNTSALEPGSWHKIYCIAADLAGNRGTSDTVNLQIAAIGQQSIFHGKITLSPNYYHWIEFSADSGRKVLGDARAVSGTISRFSLLDPVNFELFRQGRSYVPLYEQQNAPEVNLNYQFASSGTWYLVFLNTSGTVRTYWARFTLER